MSGWRAGLVAAAVGGLLLVVGVIVHAVGGGDSSGPTATAAPGDVTLVCVPALEAVCADLAAALGTGVRRFQPGDAPAEGEVVVAPAGDVADLPGTVVLVARSPVAIAVWRERALILAPGCGATIDKACLEDAYGRRWGDLGGDAAWALFKVGLADPTLSASAMEAWRLVVSSGGVPPGLDASLRVRAATRQT